MKKLYSIITALSFFLGSYITSFSQNNLSPGDIAITSYQSDLDLTHPTTGFEDRFSILVLKSGGLAANTTMYFTDHGWNSTTNTFTSSSEGYNKWIVPEGGLAQGTEVYFISGYDEDNTWWDAYTTEAGTTKIGVVSTVGTEGPTLVATAGDQVLIFQTGAPAGPVSTFDDPTVRFVTAIHANIIPNVTTYAAWDGPNGDDENFSSLPPGLTNGTTAFLMSPGPLPATASNGTTEPDNGKFNCLNGSGCTSLELSTNIYTAANWTYSNNAFPIGQTNSHCTYNITPLPTFATQPAPVTVCAGTEVTFQSTVNGAVSYQWQESGSMDFADPVTLTNTGIYGGTTTTTLSISNSAALNGKYYRLKAFNACGLPAYSNSALLTTTTAPLPTSSTSNSHDVNASNVYYGSSCQIISRITPSGTEPASGIVTSQVWVEPGVPSTYGRPYVQRHYEVTPATNAATATGTITMYFSQAEFDAFNADPGSTLKLPTGPGDNAGKANLRVGKYSGTSNNGSGLPSSYTSTNSVLDPADGNIVWNAITNQWEVTVDVTGFGGFILQTAQQVLAVNLLSFTAQPVFDNITLKWQTSNEVNNDHCEIERSSDGRTFTKVASIASINANSIKNYEWVDAGAGLIKTPKLYYRLKIISVSGSIQYSDIIVIAALHITAEIITGIVPNPFKEKFNINLHMPKNGQVLIELADITGRVFLKQKITANQGYSTQAITGAGKLSNGVYFLTADFEGNRFTYKIVK